MIYFKAKTQAQPHEQIKCYPKNWNKEPLILNKKDILKHSALIRYSFLLFMKQQEKETARKMAKKYNRSITLDEIYTTPYMQLTTAELENEARELAKVIAHKDNRTLSRESVFHQIFLFNTAITLRYQTMLNPVGVNDYERTVVPFLIEQYMDQSLSLNMPIFRHAVQAKEFDGITHGERPVLIEEKIVLRKHDIRALLSHEADKKPSHLMVCNDPVIKQQNQLPDFKGLHIIFSEIEHSLEKSKKLRILRELRSGNTLDIPAEQFVSLCENEISLPKAKKLLRSCGIQKIFLTRIDQDKANIARWTLYHQ